VDNFSHSIYTGHFKSRIDNFLKSCFAAGLNRNRFKSISSNASCQQPSFSVNGVRWKIGCGLHFSEVTLSPQINMAEVSVAEVLELRACDSLAELEVWNLLRGLLLAHTQGKSIGSRLRINPSRVVV